MIKSKFAIAIFVIITSTFFILPIGRISAQNSTEEKILGKNTPEFLSKPIIAATVAIEKYRTDMSVAYKNTFFFFIFDNRLVFYGIFLIIVIIVLRFFFG